MTVLSRFRLLKGPFAGDMFDGTAIGIYRSMHEIMNQETSPLSQSDMTQRYMDGLSNIWLNEPAVSIAYDPRALRLNDTAVFDKIEDLVIPFDRNNIELFVGDPVYFAQSNVVRKGTVEKFSKLVHMPNFGIFCRKVTIRPEDGTKAVCINDSRSTLKA